MFQKVFHRVSVGSSGVTVGMEMWLHTLSSVSLFGPDVSLWLFLCLSPWRCFIAIRGTAACVTPLCEYLPATPGEITQLYTGHQVLLSVFIMIYNLNNHTVMDHY